MKRILLAILVSASALVSATSFAAPVTDSQNGTLNDTFHYPSY